ncbi:hypothetical protein [Nissabacter sp. SGAir0207]|uniref:hypothetical protein n=1 Tax=Nissabacter sp. SGAir0207 TaxID=2126321 RepID=UPI0010F60A39|nr:hypothetical protein [Nissabacter sp. SGAir0207]
MKSVLFLSLIASSFLSWGGCGDKNKLAEQKQSIEPTAQSNYIVKYKPRVYFYSAPNEACKIKDTFIIKGDVVSVYAQYNGFSSVMFFRKNGDAVIGWVRSDSIEPTGRGSVR